MWIEKLFILNQVPLNFIFFALLIFIFQFVTFPASGKINNQVFSNAHSEDMSNLFSLRF